VLRRALAATIASALALAILGLALGAALRPPAMTPPPPGAVLHHVTLVNPGERPLPGQTVIVEGDRITRIAPTPPGVAAGPYAGAIVVPGLIDSHVHHPPPFAVGERELFALLFLSHGVTTVRDMGGAFPRSLLAHARAISEGRRAGPRVLSCGPFLDGPQPGWPGARVVRDAADGRHAVAELARAGFACAKLYNGLSPEAAAGIREAAGALGLPVVGHVPWAIPVEELEDVEVHHLMGMRPDWPVATPAHLERYAQISRVRRIRHVPTVVAFARAAQLLEPGAWRGDPVGRLLPRYHREVLWDPERNYLAREQATSPVRAEAMKHAVSRLHEAGVTIVAGTDTLNPFVVPGRALHEELHHLAAAGLSVSEAWSAATWRAGEVLGVAGLGRLAEGAPADLLLFERDPTLDLSALETLLAVVAAGRLYERPVVESALARAHAHFEGPLYEALSLRLAALGVAWLSWVDSPPDSP
jgi:cytosine/adenosine deaminase-related metal-dependent hydrolase